MDKPKVDIAPSAYLGAAAAVLILPLRITSAAVIAAAVHELCHYLALKLCKIRITSVQIRMSGVSIVTGYLTPLQQILCAAAGPAGSLCLYLLRCRIPVISLFGLVHGLFNLLPLYPLDGGRILQGICQLLQEISIRCKNTLQRSLSGSTIELTKNKEDSL